MAKQESQLFVRDFCKIGWLNFQSSHEYSFSINIKQESFVSIDILTIKTELAVDTCSINNYCLNYINLLN